MGEDTGQEIRVNNNMNHRIRVIQICDRFFRSILYCNEIAGEAWSSKRVLRVV